MHAFSAIADPTRRRIVEMLAERDRTAGELVAAFDMSAPAVSQHLNILRKAQLVRTRVEGQHRVQTLNFTGIDEIESWLQHTRRTWQARLAALEREEKSRHS